MRRSCPRRPGVPGAVVVVVALVATAVVLAQQTKLLDPNGAAGDRLGAGIAISGDLAVGGAVFADPGGVGNAGTATIWRRTGGTWSHEDTITALVPEGTGLFGADVDILVTPDDQLVIVGALFGDEVHVYRYNESTHRWDHEDELERDVGVRNDNFGVETKLALTSQGAIALAGAEFYDDDLGDGIRCGGAFVFRRPPGGGDWEHLATLQPLDGDNNDQFGFQLDLTVVDDTPRAVVCSWLDDEFGANAGAAYIFEDGGSGWHQVAKLHATDAAPGDLLGWSAAIDGDVMVVGARDADVDGNVDAGAVYVFRLENGTWTQEQKLSESTSSAGSSFGSAVDVAGDTLVVGADPGGPGKVYVFRFDGSAWHEVDVVTADDGQDGDQFLNGRLDPDGSQMIVGAETDSNEHGSKAGAVYIVPLAVAPPDADGDGLLDAWELAGGYTHSNGEYVPLPGADPLHKDVFVEIDYMTGYRPDTDFQEVRDAFANAPVENPDEVDGITLHVLVDGEVALQSPLGSGGVSTYDWSAFDAIKAAESAVPGVANFPEERQWGYHYCLFAKDISALTSGLSRGLPAGDFIVSLGQWSDGGTATQQQGTFMHELGHNLGLDHGGGDGLDHKPNYLSVMNRRFQLTGLTKDGQPHFDYSRWELDPLDEAALNEAVGLDGPAGDPDFAALQTTWQSYFRTVLSHGTVGPIDWDSDLDGSDTENPCVPNPDIPGFLSVDLNGDNQLTTLQGYDDWSNLVYKGGNLGGGGAPFPQETPVDELTYDESLAQAPPPDLKLKAHASANKIKLTWKPAGPQKDFSYAVYRLEEGQPPAGIGTSTKSNFTDNNVGPGTTYLYLVAVVSGGVEGPPHGPVAATAR